MAHTTHASKPLLARVRRIKGQVAALETALERGLDCTDVLQQTAAVRGAISALMLELLEGQLREHIAESPSAKKRSRDLEQVVRMLRSYVR